MAFWKPGTIAPGSSIDRDTDSARQDSGGGGAGAVTGRVQQIAISERRNRLPIAKQRQSPPVQVYSEHLETDDNLAQVTPCCICSSNILSWCCSRRPEPARVRNYRSSSSRRDGRKKESVSQSPSPGGESLCLAPEEDQPVQHRTLYRPPSLLRRVAAISVAQRTAEEVGCILGDEVRCTFVGKSGPSYTETDFWQFHDRSGTACASRRSVHPTQKSST